MKKRLEGVGGGGEEGIELHVAGNRKKHYWGKKRDHCETGRHTGHKSGGWVGGD